MDEQVHGFGNETGPPHVNSATSPVREAAADYRWLLDRGYPDQPAIKLVGDRYRLNRVERGMLYRGVFSSADSFRRARRLVEADDGRHRSSPTPSEPGTRSVTGEDVSDPADLTVDGHNVLFTMWNCLAGRPLVVATDRFIRDIGGTRSRLPRDERFTRLAGILCEALQRLRTGTVFVFLDEPLPWSREHASVLRRTWHKEHVSHDGAVQELVVETESGVDARIARTTTGWIATSDTGIIDRCSSPVLDLGGYIVRSSFHAVPTVLIA